MKTPTKIEQFLFSLNELKRFGINEKELLRWVRAGHLVPFTYSGKQAKYRFEDFTRACQANKRASEEEATKPSETRQFERAVLQNPTDTLNRIRQKYLN